MAREIRGLNIPRVGIQVEGEHYENNNLRYGFNSHQAIPVV